MKLAWLTDIHLDFLSLDAGTSPADTGRHDVSGSRVGRRVESG